MVPSPADTECDNGKRSTAVRAQAMGSQPTEPAMYETALRHYQTGRLAEAVAVCGTILNRGPRDFRVLRLLGLVHCRQGAFDQGAYFLTAALAAAPPDGADTLAAMNELGAALLAQQDFAAALDCYRRALATRPGDATTLHHYGNALHAAGQVGEAVAVYRQGLAAHADFAEMHNSLGNALRELGRFAEAEEHHRHALRIRPDDATALLGLGSALSSSHRHQEAVICLERALATRPGHGETLEALGNALIGLNRHAEALEQYRAARAVKPDSPELRLNEGVVLLAMGVWPEAWAWLEARLSIPRLLLLDRFPRNVPHWRGEADIEGKSILLQAEQGLGDTLHFVRYAPLVAARGARVVLRVQPALGKLLANQPGADTVISFYDAVPDVDLQCPLMSLPYAFGTRLDNVPADVPYLRVRAEYLMVWQALLGLRRRPRIGIAWSGRQHLPLRSMPLATLAPLLARPDLEFHALQQEMPAEDRAWLAAHPLVVDHSAELKDFADTAALASLMDLVVTIDTSVAHLAGALGLPVWILLPFSADARWLLDRADTPWYPTARLFRQKRHNDWVGVVAEVEKALGARMRGGDEKGGPIL